MHRRRKKIHLSIGSIVSFLLILIIGSGIAVAMNAGMKKMPIKKFFAQTHTNAVWDWSNIYNHTDKDLQSTADFLYMHQINTVYVDIGTYSDVMQLPDQEREAKTKELEASIERYVTAMSRRNIRVLAAAGNTDWSKVDQQRIPLAIQQFIFDYNQRSDAKLAGIEYDIESYNQSHFENASFTEKGLVLTELLDLIDKLATNQQQYINTTNQPDFELGFAIPYWFDNQNQNIKSVEWKDKTGPTLFHILDRLNELPKSNVVVMAYRNAAIGNDGAIYHSRTELDYAESKAQNVDVLIGVEVNDVEPEKITYYGRTYTELSSEVAKMYNEFEQTKTFGGIAINDLEGYRQMKTD